ncbi:hypothetical protein MHYP_G00051830 [Metynnis hypsauchen]
MSLETLNSILYVQYGLRFSDIFAAHLHGEKLGEGGFGSVFKGQCIPDGLEVAIKFVQKLDDEQYVQSFDELKAVHVEEVLLQIMSQSLICKTTIKLIEWSDEPDHYVLILERPLDSFLQDYEDYKYGYNIFEDTDEYCPPEFLLEGRRHAGPATVWSLGVLIFRMVCGYLPFASDDDTIGGGLHFKDGLSDGYDIFRRGQLRALQSTTSFRTEETN